MQAAILALIMVPTALATATLGGPETTTLKVFLSASSSSQCNRYRLKNWTMWAPGECKKLNGYLFSPVFPISGGEIDFWYKPSNASCSGTSTDPADRTPADLEQFTDENCTQSTNRNLNASECSDFLVTTDETLTEQYLTECGPYSGARQIGLTFLVVLFVALASMREEH